MGQFNLFPLCLRLFHTGRIFGMDDVGITNLENWRFVVGLTHTHKSIFCYGLSITTIGNITH